MTRPSRPSEPKPPRVAMPRRPRSDRFLLLQMSASSGDEETWAIRECLESRRLFRELLRRFDEWAHGKQPSGVFLIVASKAVKHMAKQLLFKPRTLAPAPKKGTA